MSKKFLLVFILQFLIGIAFFPGGITAANITTDLTCSGDSYRCNATTTSQISDIGDMLLVNTSSCDTCELHLNTTNQHGIYFDIKSLTNWTQFHHFYITSAHGQNTGITGGNTSPCTMLFPTNQLEIYFKMDAILAIGTWVINHDNGCSEKNTSVCTHNCTNVIFFDNMWEASYQVRKTTFHSD